MPGYAQPLGFVLTRAGVALIVFWLCHLFMIKEKVAGKDLFKLALCGLFGVAINQGFFFKGLNLTTPINAGIIMTSNPVFVLLIAHFLISEKIKTIKLFGILAGAGGAIILILSGKSISIGNNGSA